MRVQFGLINTRTIQAHESAYFARGTDSLYGDYEVFVSQPHPGGVKCFEFHQEGADSSSKPITIALRPTKSYESVGRDARNLPSLIRDARQAFDAFEFKPNNLQNVAFIPKPVQFVVTA